MPAQPLFRFAPSPNGRLHLGHAYSALFTEQAAKAAGGEMLLRIEDIDIARSRPEYIDGILEDLNWLGLSWRQPVRRQSEHFDDYRRMAARLNDLGLLYPCTASRKEIANAIRKRAQNQPWPRDPDGSALYPGIFTNADKEKRAQILSADKPFSLRLHMQKAHALACQKNGGPIRYRELGSGPAGETGDLETDPEIWGDVVIVRKDTPTSYHLSVVTDDALQAISHVTRGQDLFHATSLHRLLQVLLDLPRPNYTHHRIIRTQAGQKLSKSARDTSLLALRQSGVKPLELRDYLGFP